MNKTEQIKKEQYDDIVSMFALSNLLESLYRKNQGILSDTYKDKLTNALRHVKWLNKDIEKSAPSADSVDIIDSEGANIYEMIKVLRIARSIGKTSEFIDHVEKFFNDIEQ